MKVPSTASRRAIVGLLADAASMRAVRSAVYPDPHHRVKLQRLAG
jgi:hypothetical protein